MATSKKKVVKKKIQHKKKTAKKVVKKSTGQKAVDFKNKSLKGKKRDDDFDEQEEFVEVCGFEATDFGVGSVNEDECDYF